MGGLSFRYGEDQFLTAPLYTNPGLTRVLLGDVTSDHALIDRHLDHDFVANARAILVGHAHYDHLLDVPYVWTKTHSAMIYGNRSMRNLLAAFARKPNPHCDSRDGSWAKVPLSRVVALNDPGQDRVDTRLCAHQKTCTGPSVPKPGTWVSVPGANIRLRALCSMHPDQIFWFHFADGCVEEPVCEPPLAMSEWREGTTLAYLVDFLEPETETPVFRIYYQDTVTEAPFGHVHSKLLAEKRVDLAVLTVGSYNQVSDHPAQIIGSLNPRYVLAVHWENFFRTQDEPIEPIPLNAPVADFLNRAQASLGPSVEPPILVDGKPQPVRHWLPQPGSDRVFEPEQQLD